MTPVQLAWALTLGQRGAVVSYGSKVVRAGAVSACALLVRRDDFERGGGFDEGYFMFSEEADLAKRLSAKEMHYLPGPWLLHMGSSRPRACPSVKSTSTGGALTSTAGTHPDARALRWLTESAMRSPRLRPRSACGSRTRSARTRREVET
jgi:hypothetical protein